MSIKDFGFIILVLCLFSGSALCDMVYLKNGDRLSGKVNSVKDGRMKFTAEYAGHITLDMCNVETFSTDEAIKVVLKDGSELEKRVDKGGAGVVVAAEPGGGQFQEVPVGQIEKINPEKPRWKGSTTLGINNTRGNTVNSSIYLSVGAWKQTDKHRIGLNLDSGKTKTRNDSTGKDIVTEDWWKTRAKYDRYFNGRFYGFGDVRLERDKIANVDRRVLLGGGLGYRWLDRDRIHFTTETGLASRHEKFYSGSDTKTQISGQIGSHLDVLLFKNLWLINDVTYYPSTERASDYYLTATTELKYKINSHMYTNFKIIVDYDAIPAAGKKTTDTKYLLGLGWDF